MRRHDSAQYKRAGGRVGARYAWPALSWFEKHHHPAETGPCWFQTGLGGNGQEEGLESLAGALGPWGPLLQLACLFR